MATMPKAAPILADLRETESQIEAEKERGMEVRVHANAVRRSADKIEELQPTLEELGASGNITATVEQLREWAEVLSPAANQTWKQEEVEDKLKKLQALAVLDMLTEAEVEEVTRFTETLKPAYRNGGQRAPRKPAEPIEGRPEWVAVVNEQDGKVFAVQSGNKPNSGPNLKTAAVTFIKRADPEGGDLSSEDSKGLLNAAKEVAEGKSTEASYGGVIFRVTTQDD